MMGLSPFWQQPMQMPPIPFGQGAPSAPPQTNGLFSPPTMAGQMPPDPLAKGMFGGKPQINIGGAIAGYLAGSGNPAGAALLQASNQRQQMAYEEQIYEHRQNLEMQRQMAMLPLQAQLKLMYPDNAFAQEAYQSGIQPGTPQWTQAMQTRVQNELDPAVVTPQGMMLRSQITGALQPPKAPVGKLTPLGGPTPPASGNFPGY